MNKLITALFVSVALFFIFALALVALMFIIMGAIVAFVAGGLKLISDLILDLALAITAKAADRIGEGRAK